MLRHVRVSGRWISRVASRLLGALAVVAAAVITALDMTDRQVRTFFYNHNWTNQVVGSVLLVVATYAVVERLVTRRQVRRWKMAASEPVRSYASNVSLFLTVAHRNFDGTTLRASGDDAHQLEKLMELIREEGAVLRIVLSVNPELVEVLPQFMRIHDHLVRWDDFCKGRWGANDLETMLHEKLGGGQRAELRHVGTLFSDFLDRWSTASF